MEIIALQEYTDKYVSLYQGEIRNIQDNLAQKLIEQGIVAEHDEINTSSNSNSGKILIINEVSIQEGNYNFKLDVTAGEIYQAMNNDTICFIKRIAPGSELNILTFIQIMGIDYYHGLDFTGGEIYTLDPNLKYAANSSSDYPKR